MSSELKENLNKSKHHFIYNQFINLFYYYKISNIILFIFSYLSTFLQIFFHFKKFSKSMYFFTLEPQTHKIKEKF